MEVANSVDESKWEKWAKGLIFFVITLIDLIL